MVKKKAVKKKSTGSIARSKKAPTKKVDKKKTIALKKSRAKPAAAQKPISLGRPTITGEELLYMLFKDDYHARQIFEFLRVDTVKDLEQHSPKEIIQRLSQPIVQTVDRIRRTLAERNRCLQGDERFALDHKSSHEG